MNYDDFEDLEIIKNDKIIKEVTEEIKEVEEEEEIEYLKLISKDFLNNYKKKSNYYINTSNNSPSKIMFERTTS
jgi:hypothetical protein